MKTLHAMKSVYYWPSMFSLPAQARPSLVSDVATSPGRDGEAMWCGLHPPLLRGKERRRQDREEKFSQAGDKEDYPCTGWTHSKSKTSYLSFMKTYPRSHSSLRPSSSFQCCTMWLGIGGRGVGDMACLEVHRFLFSFLFCFAAHQGNQQGVHVEFTSSLSGS